MARNNMRLQVLDHFDRPQLNRFLIVCGAQRAAAALNAVRALLMEEKVDMRTVNSLADDAHM